jgi:hypothetical protein
MTRELLELAAKAAGIKVPTKNDYPYAYIDDRGIHRDISYGGDGTRMSHWNPFDDDGDALRLAVKLKLDVEFSSEEVWVTPTWSDWPITRAEAIDNDPYAATRRAIARAAAEIGRGMA